MKTKVIVLSKTLVAVIGGLGLLATIIVVTPRVRADSLATEKNNHRHNELSPIELVLHVGVAKLI